MELLLARQVRPQFKLSTMTGKFALLLFLFVKLAVGSLVLTHLQITNRHWYFMNRKITEKFTLYIHNTATSETSNARRLLLLTADRERGGGSGGEGRASGSRGRGMKGWE